MRDHPAVRKLFDVNLGHVTIQPVLPGRDNVNIIYHDSPKHASLGEVPSAQVYLHAGFGDNSYWLDVKDYPMQHTAEGWQCTINCQKNTPLHFCFKDSNNNWDNNHGQNWTVELEVF